MNNPELLNLVYCVRTSEALKKKLGRVGHNEAVFLVVTAEEGVVPGMPPGTASKGKAGLFFSGSEKTLYAISTELGLGMPVLNTGMNNKNYITVLGEKLERAIRLFSY